MVTVRKTIALTAAQSDWIKAQVASGDYSNEGEYLRDLIRRDQESASALEAAIEEGLVSGSSECGLDDIWTTVEAQRRFVEAVAQGLVDVREGNSRSFEEASRTLGIVSSKEGSRDSGRRQCAAQANRSFLRAWASLKCP